ncbi:MAG: hypothetical protein JWO58_112 [Chitinophagaceae bacterium]|nr:hypothetical protein [Chitinophagaceae bacterium]
MKKQLFILFLMIWSSLTVQAQTTAGSPPVDPLLKGRDLLQQLAGGLDVASYLDSWTPYAQSNWYRGLMKTTDAAILAKDIADLTEFIKPTAYNEGFNLTNLRSLAAEAKNYGDVANLLKTLEAGIKPEAYKNDWVSKESSWISELKFVK